MSALRDMQASHLSDAATLHYMRSQVVHNIFAEPTLKTTLSLQAGGISLSVHGRFKLFDRLFLLDDLSGHAFEGMSECTKLELASSVVLYNTALAFQIHLVRTGERWCLERASRLYHYAMEVISVEAVDAAPRLEYLMIAANNNLGNVCLQVKDEAGFDRCCAYAQTLQNAFNPNVEDEENDRDDHKLFMSLLFDTYYHQEGIELSNAPAA